MKPQEMEIWQIVDEGAAHGLKWELSQADYEDEVDKVKIILDEIIITLKDAEPKMSMVEAEKRARCTKTYQLSRGKLVGMRVEARTHRIEYVRWANYFEAKKDESANNRKFKVV